MFSSLTRISCYLHIGQSLLTRIWKMTIGGAHCNALAEFVNKLFFAGAHFRDKLIILSFFSIEFGLLFYGSSIYTTKRMFKLDITVNAGR